MNQFLVRVELHHHDDPDDYKNLHDRMYSNKFYRVIKSKDGKWRDLPPAEYFIETEHGLDHIHILVGVIAAHVLEVSPLQKSTKKHKHYTSVTTQVFSDTDGTYHMRFKLDPTTDSKKLPPGEKLI